jgi:4,5-DOPA dioxygenase extradiol
VIDYIKRGLHQPLIDYTKQGREYHIAIPSPDHFLPLLYILALQTPDDNLTIFNESIVGGALDMTSIMLG